MKLKNRPPNSITAIAFELGLLVVAIPLYFFWLAPDERVLGALDSSVLVPAFVWLLPLIFFGWLMTHPKMMRWPPLERIHQIIQHSFLMDIIKNSSVFALVMISLAAGVGEEFLFRGVLQVKWGIFVASALFGLVHFITPAYVIFATLMGLYLGLAFEITGNLWIVIFLHSAYDLWALLRLRYSPFSQNQ